MRLILGVVAILVAAGLVLLVLRNKPIRRRQLLTQPTLRDDVAADLRESSPAPLRGSSGRLRSYVYVSDTKVDMLYEQLDEASRRHFTHDLKLDAKVVSYGIQASPSPDATRAGRLSAVWAELEESHAVGTLDEPKLYFRGRMLMKTGRHPLSTEAQDAVFFMGERDDETLIFLGGTAHHLIGSVGKPTWSNSGIIGLLRALADASRGRDVNLDMYASAWPSEARGVWRAHTSTPSQPVEFVALKLAESRGQDPKRHNVILGSPLYVALVDEA